MTRAPPADHSDDDDDEAKLAPIDKLIAYLTELFFNQTLNAKQLCICMHHLKEMGYKEAEDMAMDPLSQTGKFQPRLDKVFGFDKSDAQLYPVDVPLRSAKTGNRQVEEIKTQLAFEVLAKELAERPDMARDNWQDKINNDEWIAAYENHSMVKEASPAQRRNIHAAAIYMDAAEFSDHDSLFVFTIRFVWSSRRHLLFAVRKSAVCDCGCHGWCTFYVLFQHVAWALLCAKRGIRPESRHDGGTLDAARLELAGQDLGFFVVIVDILGDWKEFSSSWGFPPWNALRPCFICPVTKDQLTNPNVVLTCRRDEEYHVHCTKCEVVVPVVTMEVLSEIRFKLQDMSTKKGRALRENIRSTLPQLKAGDRLEPSPDVPDVYAIDNIAQETFAPMTLVFWRAARPAIVNHRNPLLDQELGMGYSSFSIDVLHCQHLGVFLAYITRVLLLLLLSDAFGTMASVKDDMLKISAQELTMLLHRWYKKYEKGLEPEAKSGMTRVNYITHKMLEKVMDGKMFKLKAAESRHFMEFAVFLTRTFESDLRNTCDYPNLVLAGECLRNWMWVVNHNPRKLSPAAVDDLCRLQRQHNIAAAAAGVKMYPKHHQERSLLLENLRSVTSQHQAKRTVARFEIGY